MTGMIYLSATKRLVSMGCFFYLKLGLQQKVLCMIRLAKDSTSPEMFDDLAMISSVLVRVFSSL